VIFLIRRIGTPCTNVYEAFSTGEKICFSLRKRADARVAVFRRASRAVYTVPFRGKMLQQRRKRGSHRTLQLDSGCESEARG